MGTEGKPPRQWQEIAEEASHETEPEKLIILAVELERALELRDEKLREKMGDKARESVRQKFLLSRYVEQYLDLFAALRK